MCILHVFCVLAEYAIILKIIQIEKRKVTARLRKLEKANNALSGGSVTSLNNKSYTSLSPDNNANGNNDHDDIDDNGDFLDSFTTCFSSR
jgi:hypothetical protein